MKINVKNLTIAAFLLALGVLLPYVIHSADPSMTLGTMLLPMHFPVLICGLVCGWKYGGICGAAVPFLAMLLTGRPPMPLAASIALELCVYGVIAGLMHKKFNVYISLITAMILGRIAGGGASAYLLGSAENPYTLSVFMNAYFVYPAVGIYLQLVLIPAVMYALYKAGLVKKTL